MPIDTHKVFKHLRADNVFSDEQAERIAESLSDLDVASATKEDLDSVETRLNKRMDDLEHDLKIYVEHRIEGAEGRLTTKIEEVRSSLTRTVIASVAAVGAVLAVVVPLSIYLLG